MRRLLGLAALAALAVGYGVAVADRAELSAPSPTPILTDRHGLFLAQLGHETEVAGERRTEYGYWQVSPPPERIVRATLALEDRRFWSHPGVDPLSVLRAAWQNLTGLQVRSGASTIAMQVARMQRPAPRNLWSKALEAGTAVALTLRYGRQAVLEQYLRLVPYGNGSHGIAHAARIYFDKPVGDLGWAEIALLSAIPQAPALHNPRHPNGLRRAVARGQRALSALAARGTIAVDELDTARAQLAALALPDAPQRPAALHLVARLRRALERDGAVALDPADPRLRTRIDLGVQGMVEALALAHLDTLRPRGAQQVAVMVARRADRQVVAAMGSAGFTATPGGAFDFTSASRSPGSTFKPFLYALALQRGDLAPAEIMGDLPDGASGIANADGAWLGPILPRQALANSRNVPATNLLRRMGLDAGFGVLARLGLHDEAGQPEHFGLSMAIGGLPTSLERLMRAYGALGGDGWLAELDWYEGQTLAPRRQVLTAEAARLVTLFLADPQARLPSFPRYGPTEFPFPAALKTGTSQGYRDAWMIAFSGEWIVGVWIGRADDAPMDGLTGGNAAGPLANSVLQRLHGMTPGLLVDGGFPPPAGFEPVELCAQDGRPNRGRCGRTLTEWVRPGGLPQAEDVIAIQAAPTAPLVPRLTIISPENNARFWRNPELPAALNRMPLRASVSHGVEQVVWYVDDEPFAVAVPGETVYWPMSPGQHRFQLRMPFARQMSRPTRVVIE